MVVMVSLDPGEVVIIWEVEEAVVQFILLQIKLLGVEILQLLEGMGQIIQDQMVEVELVEGLLCIIPTVRLAGI